MKSPFSRIIRRQSKADDVSIPVPEEIKAYYQAESKDNMLKIWLLSAATFVVTLLVILGIFWGGRWLWRRSHQPSSKPAPIANQDQSQDKKPANSAPATPSASSTPAPAPAPTPTNTSAPAPSPAASSTPSTSNSSQLIDTGPGNVDL
jgi:hypothetical protein